MCDFAIAPVKLLILLDLTVNEFLDDLIQLGCVEVLKNEMLFEHLF
jgi:hypothetical protein